MAKKPNAKSLKPLAPSVAPVQATPQPIPAAAPKSSPVPPTPAIAAPKARPAAAPAPATPAPKASPVPVASVELRPVQVTFVLLEAEARQVALSGQFNAWSPDAVPMRRQSSGRWEATLALPPGRHQYKYVVDGRWIPDPNARENVANEFGTLNSVIEVKN